MGTIYILREQLMRDESGTMCSMDYSPALDFGDTLEVVTNVEADTVMGGSALVKQMVDDIRSMAKAYDPRQDFVIATGAPTVIMLAGMLLHEAGHTRVQLLKWNPREKRYRRVVWDLQEIV